jgi:hypothetical protein
MLLCTHSLAVGFTDCLLWPHPLLFYIFMLTKTSSDGTTIVDMEYFWQPINTCPIGRKVQLLGKTGVAVYGTRKQHDTFWTHWAPLPKVPK